MAQRYPLVLLLAALALLPACSSVTVEEPALSDSLLVDVLIDLHLARARQQFDESLPPTLRDSILAQHGLDEAQFIEAMAYYAEHAEAYVALYTDVLSRLNEERIDHLDSPPATTDSTDSQNP